MEAAREYLAAAETVVRVVTDIDAPELAALDDRLPAEPRDAEALVELADRWNLGSPVNGRGFAASFGKSVIRRRHGVPRRAACETVTGCHGRMQTTGTRGTGPHRPTPPMCRGCRFTRACAGAGAR
jgi:hypothetical protein